MNKTLRHPRVDVADVLRGFAVMAIILLHSIEHFNFYKFPDPATQPMWLNFSDKALWNGLFFMFGGKAYAIFALLFGFSFFIQDDNQRMRGNDFRSRFAWRLFLLFMIGQVNAVFFTGEILVLYALVGFVLIAVCRLSTKTLVKLGALCLIQPICIYQVIRAVANPEYTIPSINSSPFWAATFAGQDGGDFMQMARANIWEGQLASLAWAWEHGRVFQTAGLFIFGMLIGRQGWFNREKLPYWGTVLAIALCCFFPLSGLNNMIGGYIDNPNIRKSLGIIVSSLANLSFMLVLVCGILFGYYKTVRLSALLSRLIPYGRMSMTNYVTQGMIGAFLFYHWGLHLSMGTTYSLLVGILVFMLQYIACVWWTRRHSHGPLEYMWKRATWLKI